jgi:hypothetical protein
MSKPLKKAVLRLNTESYEIQEQNAMEPNQRTDRK